MGLASSEGLVHPPDWGEALSHCFDLCNQLASHRPGMDIEVKVKTGPDNALLFHLWQERNTLPPNFR